MTELIKAGIAIDERESGGTVVVKLDDLLGLEDETYRVLVLMRSDGTTLYGAWDLVLAKKKFADYPLDRSIYVVDVRQSLHFKQVFKTLELAGWDKTDQVYHLPYEIVNLPGNVTMSSREGTVVLLEDLINEAIQRAYEVSEERNPDLDEETRKDRLPRQWGSGRSSTPCWHAITPSWLPLTGNLRWISTGTPRRTSSMPMYAPTAC